MTTELKPCPFCGGKADPEGWMSTDCKGPACDDCGASANSADAWNTRTVPDVPELVPVAWNCKFPTYGHFTLKEHEAISAKAEGAEVQSLVPLDQAAAMIWEERQVAINTRNILQYEKDQQWRERTEAAEAKIAQIKAQEPVGYRSRANDWLDNYPWSYYHLAQGETAPESHGQWLNQPLYAAPVASEKTVEALWLRIEHLEMCLHDAETQITASVASETETIERLRTALTIIENPLKHFQNAAEKAGANLDGIVAFSLSNDAGFLKKIAADALSGKEPS